MNEDLYNKIFAVHDEGSFEQVSLEVFRYQFEKNAVYNEYTTHLGIQMKDVKNLADIPFLPIDLFRSRNVVSGNNSAEFVFTSSGTTGQEPARHYITDIGLYKKSFRKCFEFFYGNVNDYCILALLPSYQEQKDSSLVFMMEDLIKLSDHNDSSFYLNDTECLVFKIKETEAKKQKILLFGVSYALLDLAESYDFDLQDAIVMETGGMKGKRKELTRPELHDILKKGFSVKEIHSEYGMTELLSQAYSKGKGVFYAPPWMKIKIRDTYDPFNYVETGSTGGINIIDLANVNSCSFIETMDLGRSAPDGGFEVSGRYDNSSIRGCNLMI